MNLSRSNVLWMAAMSGCVPALQAPVKAWPSVALAPTDAHRVALVGSGADPDVLRSLEPPLDAVVVMASRPAELLAWQGSSLPVVFAPQRLRAKDTPTWRSWRTPTTIWTVFAGPGAIAEDHAREQRYWAPGAIHASQYADLIVVMPEVPLGEGGPSDVLFDDLLAVHASGLVRLFAHAGDKPASVLRDGPHGALTVFVPTTSGPEVLSETALEAHDGFWVVDEDGAILYEPGGMHLARMKWHRSNGWEIQSVP